jgi:hypothetical protein
LRGRRRQNKARRTTAKTRRGGQHCAISLQAIEVRGCEDGHDLDDWLEAERKMRQPAFERAPSNSVQNSCTAVLDRVIFEQFLDTS